MKISYSYGIMDLFHYGHLKALKTAANGADLHVVGLLSDSAAKSWIGYVVSNEQERRAVLESIDCVDWVMHQETLDPTENLKKLHYIYPDAEIALFRGDGISVIAATGYLQSIAGSVHSIDYYERLSPSEILKALNSRSSLSERRSNVISTKANTLVALKELVKCARIEDIVVVTVYEVKTQPDQVVERIKKQFCGSKIVIRSSCSREDSFDSSNAGHYESVLGVDSNDAKAILSAIVQVYSSYGKDGSVSDDEQVLVQMQTQNVKYSGVVFTRDIQQNRPYYIINYDDSGSTDSVTSGVAGKSIEIAQDAEMDSIPIGWRSLYSAIKELESILSRMLLDIEFAVTEKNEIVIFQVRPLAASYKFGRVADTSRLLDYKTAEKNDYEKFILDGSNPVMSDMAFWNPAEIIGTNPHLLDYSLYRMIITHRAWNEGLVSIGYAKVNKDLMYRYGNKPYICVDYAFRALIPSSLDEELSSKLCNFYLNALKNDLTAHDKIEFEVAMSCFDFSLDKRLSVLKSNGFTDDEILLLRNALVSLTESVVKSYPDILNEDVKSLSKLQAVREVSECLYKKNNVSVQELSHSIKELLESICCLGTPQFSRQARYAFIARSIADSLKKEEIWTSNEYDNFMSSIETVASKFERDFKALQSGVISKASFDKEYGHLRAGTYDIRKPRYDTMSFDMFISKEDGKESNEASHPYSINNITPIPKSSSIKIKSEEWLSFMRTALEQREYFKFEFTKSLSLALEIIAKMADLLGFSRSEMSYFDINEIISFSIYGTAEEIKKYITKNLSVRKEEYKLLSKLILPSVITKPSDFDFIETSSFRPNFITEKVVRAETCSLDNEEIQSVEGKIVIIEKADPGYDWIFAKGIAGLITCYGGVASHMAIRCAEFGVPAAIGCGQKIFQFAMKSIFLELDCKAEKIRSIQL